MVVLEMLLLVASLAVSVIETVPQNTTQHQRQWQEISQTYDKNMEPTGTDGGPTAIKLEVFIRDVESIDDSAMVLNKFLINYEISYLNRNPIEQKWSIHLTLTLHWLDFRLKSEIPDISAPFPRHVPESSFHKLWLPTLFFEDGWDTTRYNVLGKNTDFKQLKLTTNQNGDITLTLKTFLNLGSPMEFKSYPFDTQICRLKILYNGILAWIHFDPVKITAELKLTNFAFVRLTTNSCSEHKSLDDNANNTSKEETSTSCLILECEFERETSFYQCTVFIPSIFVISIVWLSLFLDPLESAGARSIILASSTMTGTLLGCFLIKVPALYSTALCRWTIVCQVFLFVGVLEFVAVNRLAMRQKQRLDLGDNPVAEQNPTNAGQEDESKLRNLTVQRKWHVTVDILFRVNYLLAFLVFNLRYYFTFVKRPDLEG